MLVGAGDRRTKTLLGSGAAGGIAVVAAKVVGVVVVQIGEEKPGEQLGLEATEGEA